MQEDLNPTQVISLSRFADCLKYSGRESIATSTFQTDARCYVCHPEQTVNHVKWMIVKCPVWNDFGTNEYHLEIKTRIAIKVVTWIEEDIDPKYR